MTFKETPTDEEPAPETDPEEPNELVRTIALAAIFIGGINLCAASHGIPWIGLVLAVPSGVGLAKIVLPAKIQKSIAKLLSADRD